MQTVKHVLQQISPNCVTITENFCLPKPHFNLTFTPMHSHPNLYIHPTFRPPTHTVMHVHTHSCTCTYAHVHTHTHTSAVGDLGRDEGREPLLRIILYCLSDSFAVCCSCLAITVQLLSDQLLQWFMHWFTKTFLAQIHSMQRY